MDLLIHTSDGELNVVKKELMPGAEVRKTKDGVNIKAGTKGIVLSVY